MGPVGFDSRLLSPVHAPAWGSVMNAYYVKVYVSPQVCTINNTHVSVKGGRARVDPSHVEVVFMGWSYLYFVQSALSLAEGYHGPARSPPLSLQPTPSSRARPNPGTHRPPGLIDVPLTPTQLSCPPPLPSPHTLHLTLRSSGVSLLTWFEHECF